jgi:competence protein ComEA
VAVVHVRLAALAHELGRPLAEAPRSSPVVPVTGGWTPSGPLAPRHDGTPDHLPAQPRTPAASAEPPGEELAASRGLRGRWGIELPAGVGLVAVAVIAVVGALAWGWYARAKPVSLAAPIVAATPILPTVAPSATAAAELVVDVTGRVGRPGIVRLPEGSRVVDAIRAAGGARQRRDLRSVNLARVLVDGEQIVVGGSAAAAAAAPAGTAPAPAVVDLNTADATALDTLPGIGPVLAQRIVDYRTQHGRFTDITELEDVSGIGDATFADLRDLVRV